MSKFWQTRLNASWKETVSSTVNGLSDGAARLRQNLQIPPDGRPVDATGGASPENAAGKAQQHLRLPVESAKKLRWYDRPDLNNLVQQNLRDKNDLLGVNAALRQVLLAKGISEDDLEAELEEKLMDVDRMRIYDDGVNSVLVASAADEIQSLRGQIDQQANEIQQLNERLASAEAAVSRQSDASAGQNQHLPDRDRETPPQPSRSTASLKAPPPSSSATNSAQPWPSSADVPSSSHSRSQDTHASPSETQHSSEKEFSGQNAAQTLSDSQTSPESSRAGLHLQNNSAAAQPLQLTLTVSEASSSVQAILSPTASSSKAIHSNKDSTPRQISSQSANGDAAEASSSGAHALSAQQTSEAEDRQDLYSSTDMAEDASDLQQLLAEERKKVAGLIGKLQRLEEERQMHVEQISAQDATLEDMDRQGRVAQAQADAALQNFREVVEASERQIAHLRAQAATTSGQHVEALRKAQDICSQTEAKASAADRKAQKADAELRRVTNDLRARERECSAAQAELDRGANASTSLVAAKRAADDRETELRRSLAEADAKHKQQTGQLSTSIQQLQRSLAASQQEVASLEQRLAKAEQSEGDALRELREAEATAVEQEGLLLRAAALEGKLKELQAEQGQLDTYKQLTKELEAAKARVEDEMIATVQIATGLEGRLREARAEADLAQQQAQQADHRAHQAEQAVQEEAERRVSSIGNDRSRWPLPAREEVAHLEKKQQAMSSMLGAIQRNLEQETEFRKAEASARAAALERCAAADERVTKLEWESAQATASLQRKVTLLQQQLEDMRQAAADAEQERDRLMTSQRRISSHPSFGSLGPNTPKRGSGSLRGVSSALFDNESGTPTNGSREHIDGVDIVYLKNVLFKFVDAHAHGRTQECSTLLPAIAALLRASPLEYRILKDTLQRSEKTGNWWARAVSQ